MNRNNVFKLTVFKVIINKERNRLMKISVLFKTRKFAPLKSIYFHFKTPTKQILVFLQKKLGKLFNYAKKNLKRENPILLVAMHL